MNIIQGIVDAEKCIGEAILALISGGISLNPEALAKNEENLGELNFIELSLLTIKKHLAMSELLFLGAVIFDELAAFLLRLRFPLLQDEDTRICIRSNGNKIVVALTDSKIKDANLILVAILLNREEFLDKYESPKTIRSKKKF